MFSKKCFKCARRIEKDFDYCPYCGNNIKREQDSQDFGFLGKDDFINFDDLNKLSGESMLDKMLKNTMKMLTNELGSSDVKKTNFQLFVNGKKIDLSQAQSSQQVPQHVPVKAFSEEKAKASKKLPRVQAETNVRRMGNKLVYEISLPGVFNLDSIVMNKLESGIEIKAFSNDKVYFKSLPVNLPIISYKLENEVLVLELKAK